MDDIGGQERRRAPRVRLRAPVPSRVYSVVEAGLVDLSVLGALLEHAGSIRPGASCEVLIEDSRQGLRLQGRVVRSAVWRPEEALESREIRYHTGIEFVGLTPTQADALEGMLRRHGDPAGGAPARGLRVFLLL